MLPRTRNLAAGVCAGFLIAPFAAMGQPRATADATVVAEFGRRVQTYESLHDRVAQTVPPVTISDDPHEIAAAIAALGEAIRAARPQAREGDLFFPDAAVLFRGLIRDGCSGRFQFLLRMTHEDIPPLGRAVVNGHWPGEAFTFMPPAMLRAFPRLPSGLEYRFVNRDLVIWDSGADLVVDVLRNAIPASTT